MLVRFNKRTIIGGTIYTPESGEVELANDIADQVVAAGNGVVVGFGAYSNEARLSTDLSGNTVLVGAGGTEMLTFDANGNIVANVNHRTGHVANLLTLDGGKGEVSSADDMAALVLHTGVAGGARAIYASRNRAVAAALVNATSVAAAGTLLSIVGQAGFTSLVDITDTANRHFIMPSDASSDMILNYKLGLPAHGGTYVQVVAESLVPEVGWFAVGTAKHPVLFGGEARELHATLQLSNVFADSTVRRLRVRVLHDHVSAYSITGSMILQAFKG